MNKYEAATKKKFELINANKLIANRTKRDHKVNYKCISCGKWHHEDILKANDRNFKCKKCYSLITDYKFSENLERIKALKKCSFYTLNKGLQVISKDFIKDTVTYKCMNCGETITKNHIDAAAGNFKCDSCVAMKKIQNNKKSIKKPQIDFYQESFDNLSDMYSAFKTPNPIKKINAENITEKQNLKNFKEKYKPLKERDELLDKYIKELIKSYYDTSTGSKGLWNLIDSLFTKNKQVVFTIKIAIGDKDDTKI